MSRPIEPLGPDFPAPYVQTRKVRFGHTDSARIAYTVRFFDYALEAIEGWFEEVLTIDWFRLNTIHEIGTPFVHVDMDIQAPLTVGDAAVLTVLVKEAGRTSLRFAVSAARDDGTPVFRGEWVCVFVDTATMRPIDIPPVLTRRINGYQARCTGSGNTLNT